MTDKEVQEAVARADAEYDMLKDRVHEQYDEIEKLKEDIDYYKKGYAELYKRIDEAIEYLESYNTDFKNCRFGEAPISLRELGDLLDILKGSDKE